MTDYTELAQRLNEAYVKAHPFHGPATAMDSADLSLRDASALIKEAALEKARILKSIQEQRGAQQELEEARENVGLLPDREAMKIQREWIEHAKQQGEAYSQSKNRGATPRATQGVDPDIRSGVLTWIESKRKRNWFKKTN